MQQKQILKNATDVDISKLAEKIDLASLKSKIDKLDVDKLEKVPSCSNSFKSKVDKLDVDKVVPVPVDLSKLSGTLKHDAVKKMYIMLKSKTALSSEINEVKKGIPSITN